jgi:hypothetical protein
MDLIESPFIRKDYIIDLVRFRCREALPELTKVDPALAVAVASYILEPDGEKAGEVVRALRSVRHARYEIEPEREALNDLRRMVGLPPRKARGGFDVPGAAVQSSPPAAKE